MTDIIRLSVGLSFASGLVSLGLLALALRAYVRSREPSLVYVAGAFTVFAAKSFLVAYSIWKDLIPHDSLEFVDAVGDLLTVFLFVLPIFRPAR